MICYNSKNKNGEAYSYGDMGLYRSYQKSNIPNIKYFDY